MNGLPFLLLTIGDHFAKKAWFRITKTERAEEVMQILETIFQSGAVKPLAACFDNGPAFKSNLFHQYLSDKEILIKPGVPYWPQGQGFVERLHKTVKSKLALLKLPRTTTFEELSQHVLNLENQYNNTPHETLVNRTPNAVYYNLPTSSREFLYKNYSEIQKEVEEDAKTGHSKYLRTLIRKSQQLYSTGRTVQVGDRVIVLHGRAYKGRIQVIRTYLGAGTITRCAPDNSALFFVRWLNNGKGSVVKDQESQQPFPNQYEYFNLVWFTPSNIFFSAFVKVPESITTVSLIQKLEEGDTFEVEVILAKFCATNEEEDKFLVKWKGYPIITATFENREEVSHLLEHYPDLLDATKVGIERAATMLQVFPTTETFLNGLNAAVADTLAEEDQLRSPSVDPEVELIDPPPVSNKTKKSPKKKGQVGASVSSSSSKKDPITIVIDEVEPAPKKIKKSPKKNEVPSTTSQKR